jgi:hypothetical protein
MCAMNARLLRPLASGFNPKSIAGLEAWYAADVASSITIATGVQQWSDLSGKGRHLIQNVTNNQPAYNSVTLNGKPTITFDGSNDLLQSANFTVAQPYSYIAVFRFESAYVSGGPRAFDAGNVARSGEVFRNAAGEELRVFSAPGGSVLVGNLMPAGTNANFNIFDFEFNSTASAIRLRKNAFAVTGTTGSNAGERLTVGASGGLLGNNSHISVAEFLMFSRVLAAAESDRVRAYLGRKYNLAFQA